jgi:phytoene dehydrogenase-like protein
LDPLLDVPPVDFSKHTKPMEQFSSVTLLLRQLFKLGKDIPSLAEMLVAPADKILNRWFESEPLKALLATDSIVGAFASPSMPGSAYVLLHHVMGGYENNQPGSWSYVRGGMGGISAVIASAAKSYGAIIKTNSPVKQVIVKDGSAKGVVLENGEEYYASKIISNCDPFTTFLKLVEDAELSDEFKKRVRGIDFSSGVFKINLAVDRLPNFTAKPNQGDFPNPQHQG